MKSAIDSAWLYTNLGTIAQVAGGTALLLIGILTLLRKRKGKKLSRPQHSSEIVSPKHPK